eukprot:TRINITY_DN6727_c0_g1_i2.p1 TRINITY_DN6727_c0_g1~~TRINITY_DN6727_c0_g1_i2.p1  ORF type:complete len:279 (-),score=48.51 TRINITY_DN6727_c0_g1_i2:480-1316(-)
MVKKVKRSDYTSEEEEDGFKYRRIKRSTGDVASTSRNTGEVPSISRNVPIKPFSAEEATKVLPSLESLKLEGLTKEEKICKITDAICKAVYFDYFARNNPEHTELCLAANSFVEALSARMHAIRENRERTKDLEAQVHASTMPAAARVPPARSGVLSKEALLALKARAEEERVLTELQQRRRMLFAEKTLEVERICAEARVDYSDAVNTARAAASELKETFARADKMVEKEKNFERAESLCERAEKFFHENIEQVHSDIFKDVDIDTPRQFLREVVDH